MTPEVLGFTPDGHPVHAFTLSNARGLQLRVMEWGATLLSLRVPDRNGDLADVVLGHQGLQGYLAGPAFLGGVVGRYANRIGGASFVIDGQVSSVTPNEAPNHLHGGARGFDKRLWTGQMQGGAEGDRVVFARTSPAGEEGYPGTLTVQVSYHLTRHDALVVDYRGSTDAPTVVNLTQHAYFNLAGEGDVLDHVLTLNADGFTPVDGALLPTGAVTSVEATPLDFRSPRRLGDGIHADDDLVGGGGGYDHNFVLNRAGIADGELALAGRLDHPASGRRLEVFTTEPGLQLYTANFPAGTISDRTGAPYPSHPGVCLETQHFPDSPNKHQFPTTVLRPGERYRSRTVFKFGVVE